MTADPKTLSLLALLAGVVLLALLAGFEGWIRHAGALMLAYGEAGISWCL